MFLNFLFYHFVNLYVYLILGDISFCVTEAVLCYACHGSDECMHDTDGMLGQGRAFLDGNGTFDDIKRASYLKNCSGAWGDKCLIERIESTGNNVCNNEYRVTFLGIYGECS